MQIPAKTFRLCILNCAFALAFSSSAEAGLLYTINDSNNHLVSIDTATLARTDIGYTGIAGGNFGGLAYNSSNDTLYWVAGRDNNNLYTLNRNTGAASLVGSHGVNDLFGLEYDPTSGKLFGSQFAGGSGLFSLNMTTGAATSITGSMSNQIGGLAFDSTRNQLLGISDGSGAIYNINRSTGSQTLVATPGGNNDSGFAYDSDLDKLWDIDWSGNLFRYDPTAGYARTTVLSGLGSHDGLAYVSSNSGQQNNVPEPGILALFGIGLAALRFMRSKSE